MKADKDWLATLSVGSAVAIRRSGGFNSGYRKSTVLRITATQLVIEGPGAVEQRVNREDGSIRGESYQYIEPITQKVLDHVEYEKLCRWLDEKTRSHSYPPLAQLRVMKAAVDELDKATAKASEQ